MPSETELERYQAELAEAELALTSEAYDSAERIARRALDLNPDGIKAKAILGKSFYKRGLYRQAMTFLQPAALYEDESQVLLLVSQIRCGLNRLRKMAVTNELVEVLKRICSVGEREVWQVGYDFLKANSGIDAEAKQVLEFARTHRPSWVSET